MKKKILLAQTMDSAGIDYLHEKGYEVVIAPSEEENCLAALIHDCAGVISKTCYLDKELLRRAPNLKVVGKHGVGVDNVVNTDDATTLGICVVNTPYANSSSVAEHTMGFILALAKQYWLMDAALRRGDFFMPERLSVFDVKDKTLALIGFGSIGRQVAKMAHDGFGMKIIVYDPYLTDDCKPSYVQKMIAMEDVLRQGDYVSLHLPGNENTHCLIGQNEFSLMQPHAGFVNCARGSIVDPNALIHALRTKQIRAAALDVFEEEPLPVDSPLNELENVILTPHSSALSVEALKRMSIDVAMGVDEVLSGAVPTWCVNRGQIK